MTRNHCDLCDKVLALGDPHFSQVEGDIDGKPLVVKILVFHRGDSQRPLDLCPECHLKVRKHRGLP